MLALASDVTANDANANRVRITAATTKNQITVKGIDFELIKENILKLYKQCLSILFPKFSLYNFLNYLD